MLQSARLQSVNMLEQELTATALPDIMEDFFFLFHHLITRVIIEISILITQKIIVAP